MKPAKGFLNSFVAILITVLLLELLFSFQLFAGHMQRSQQDSFTVKYADYYFDDITYDLTHLTSDNPALYRINATYVGIRFTNSEVVTNFGAILGNYSAKAQSYSARLNVNFSINTSDITADGMRYEFSNGVVYLPSYGQQDKSQLISSPAVEMKNYTIDFATNLTRQTLGDFNYLPSGDIYVKVNYTDGTGNYSSEGFLNAGNANVFHAGYANNGSFEAHVQKVVNNPGSFYIVMDKVTDSVLTVDAIMENNGTYPVYIMIPIRLNITTFAYSKSGVLLPIGV